MARTWKDEPTWVKEYRHVLRGGIKHRHYELPPRWARYRVPSHEIGFASLKIALRYCRDIEEAYPDYTTVVASTRYSGSDDYEGRTADFWYVGVFRHVLIQAVPIECIDLDDYDPQTKTRKSTGIPSRCTSSYWQDTPRSHNYDEGRHHHTRSKVRQNLKRYAAAWTGSVDDFDWDDPVVESGKYTKYQKC